MRNFPKGSEWRKWDLHVHTPASFHWNGGKRLHKMNDTEKQQSFRQMLDTINASDVSVFAITDYWTLDGYFEFMEQIEKNGWELKKTVFPGMELRLEAPVNYRLNIQVIFSDNLSKQQLNDFKSTLKIARIDRNLSEEALKQIPDILSEDIWEKYGFKKENITEDELLLFGAMTAEITRDSFRDAIKTLPNNQRLIILPFDTNDGLEGLDWEDHPLAATDLMRLPDIFETRKPETLDFFVGRRTEKNEKFIDNVQHAIGGVPKPAICGSDAHKYSDYGIFPGNKICWIKADPTFEGLQQILYEPETRVKIQDLKPEEKTNYLVIDKVRFIDDRENADFSSEYIELNPNLNVIIGGKSSGKSLLLYHIARTIDPKQVEDKLGEDGQMYNFEFDDDFNFEVKWKDGRESYLKEEEGQKANNLITYIPQMYIHKLADENGKEDLNELILDILLQNSSFREFYEKQCFEIKSKQKEIESLIIRMFDLKRDIEQEEQDLREKGNKEAIQKEIENLRQQIEVVIKESNFSKEEDEQFKKLSVEKEKLEEQLNKANEVEKGLDRFKSEFDHITKKYKNELEQAFVTLKGLKEDSEKGLKEDSEDFIKEVIDVIGHSIETKVSNLMNLNFLENAKEDITKKIKEIEMNISSLNKDLLPLTVKLKNQSRINELRNRLEQQKDILTKIEEVEKQHSYLLKKYEDTKSRILPIYEDMLNLYKNIADKLKEDDFYKVSDEIHLETTIKFDVKGFYGFVDSINRRKRLSSMFNGVFNENDEFEFDIDEHVNNISRIFETLIDKKSEIKLKSGNSLKQVVQKLFEDYFIVDFDLIQNSDHINHMSPGKRGLVLLQLFLHLSNAKYPILIDQPEDNLDNRTIYTELNSFIKSKKIDRQIIIVTHNANLVVLTDAEEVIVANQAGQQVNRDNAKYKFEYVSGSLECSFEDDSQAGILYKKGIKEHVCEILEGGIEAFEKRERKYGF